MAPVLTPTAVHYKEARCPSRAPGTRTRLAAALTALLVVTGLATVPPAAASSGADRPGTRDPVVAASSAGPELLRREPAAAPQLTNVAPWTAAPILVSGASAYRDGEFLYQDYLYDDRGAGETRASPPNAQGTYTYPPAPTYGGNAADLVEIRTRLVHGALAFRITYNTLHDPDMAATTLMLGTSDSPVALPHGAGVSSLGEVFVTAHGASAEVVRATGGAQSTAGVSAAVDVARRQVDVRVPFDVFDPRAEPFRLAAASGVWDTQSGSYWRGGMVTPAPWPTSRSASTSRPS